MRLVHAANEAVDELLAVTGITSLDEVTALHGEASKRGGELEGPDEVVGFLEVGTNRVDLVDEVLHADDTLLAESLLNDRVVGEGNALASTTGDGDLPEATLVDELLDRLEVRVPPSDVGLNTTEHVEGRLVDLDEDTVVDLTKTEQLKDLLGLGVDGVDTANTDHERKLRLTLDEEVASLLGLTLQANGVILRELVCNCRTQKQSDYLGHQYGPKVAQHEAPVE
jgi:hypothetical protein